MDDSTNRCESACSTSTHSSVIRMNNLELMNTLHKLNDAVCMINKAFVSLIEEPVQTIENSIEFGVLLNKKELKKEKDLLKKTVLLLSDGVKKMRNVFMNQRKACDKFFECEEYKRVCDVDYISPLSTVDKTDSEDLNEGTLLNSLPRESDVGVLRDLDGLTDDFECNYRPCSAPCFRFNSTIIENRRITAREDKPSSDRRNSVLANTTENKNKVEEKMKTQENTKPRKIKETVSDTLVNTIKDRVVEEMSCKLSESDSNKLVSVISDKLVESISDNIVYSVTEKVAAVVSDKLLQPIKSRVYSYKNSSESGSLNVLLNDEKARYFVIKTRDKEKILKSTQCNVWSSTKECNKVLNAACNDQKGVGPIYLFVSVVKSKKFFGCAEMSRTADFEAVKSNGKQNTDKSKDCFQVRWIVVKDIPNDNLSHLIIEKKSKTYPVTKSKNTQEMSKETGMKMMEIFHCY